MQRSSWSSHSFVSSLTRSASANADAILGVFNLRRVREAIGLVWMRDWWLSALSVVLVCSFPPFAASSQIETFTRSDAQKFLRAISTWGCQYQNIEIEKLAATSLDLVVIDPVLDGGTGRRASRAEVDQLKTKPDGNRRMVLAYLAIGAAEEYRAYWKPEWLISPPRWLGEANPAWPLSHAVRYWDPEWQKIVTDGLQQIVDAGFDGVFLDRVDAFHDWRDVEQPLQAEMTKLVAEIAETSRKSVPGFVLISQNAEPLLSNSAFRGAIDAVSKESLLTGLQGEGVPNTVEQIAWSMSFLSQAQNAGLVVLAIEYVSVPNQQSSIARRLQSMRFKPFIANRLLDVIPTTDSRLTDR